MWFLEGLEHAQREVAQARGVRRAMPGTDAAAVFIVVPIHLVVLGFDAPVATIESQQTLWRGLIRWPTGDAEYHFAAPYARFLIDAIAFNKEALANVREVEVIVQFARAPDAALFDAPVGQGRLFGEVRCATLPEVQLNGLLKRRLVALDREMIVRALPDNKLGNTALGQECVGGDVAALDVACRKQGRGGADFVGLLQFVGTRYGQGADFFWA